MSEENASHPSETPPSEPGGFASGAVLTPLALQHLNHTRPWVRVLAILSFVGSGFMILMGIGVMLIGLAGGMAPGEASPARVGSAIAGTALGILYVAMSAVYIAPGIFLHRYAKSIAELKTQPSSLALERALGHQKSFWKFLGITAVIGSGIGVLVLLVSVAIGVAAAVAAAAK